MPFHFTSSESHKVLENGNSLVKEQLVNVKNGQGTKTVRITDNLGTRSKTLKLSPEEIKNVANRKFMPNLFSRNYKLLRKSNNYRKTRKNRKGSR